MLVKYYVRIFVLLRLLDIQSARGFIKATGKFTAAGKSKWLMN